MMILVMMIDDLRNKWIHKLLFLIGSLHVVLVVLYHYSCLVLAMNFCTKLSSPFFSFALSVCAAGR